MFSHKESLHIFHLESCYYFFGEFVNSLYATSQQLKETTSIPLFYQKPCKFSLIYMMQ